jgi:hypothetical protein
MQSCSLGHGTPFFSALGHGTLITICFKYLMWSFDSPASEIEISFWPHRDLVLTHDNDVHVHNQDGCIRIWLRPRAAALEADCNIRNEENLTKIKAKRQ